MGAPDKNGLESASVLTAFSGMPISPATITFISVPDYEYSGSGNVSLGGSSDYFVGISKEFESSWSILGVFESGFDSEWGVGEGEYYWYRVEGSCGEVRCDTAGVVYDTCKRMTYMTVVAAKNLTELCYKLANPLLNPKVDFRLSSIKKYSRPLTRSDSDLCNTLETQDFCQIAECLEYCIDQDVAEKMAFSMRAIESVFVVDMIGGIRISGQIQTDRNKAYEPEFPIIGFSGSFDSLVILSHNSAGTVSLSGTAYSASSSYDFLSQDGGVSLGGFARTMSPSRKYLDSDGGVEIYGSAKTLKYAKSEGGISLSGSTETFLRMSFGFSGKIELGGRLLDYVSPTFRISGSGSVYLEGTAPYNFADYGLFRENFNFIMNAFDFGSESLGATYASKLTISENSIVTSCGCGPLAQSIELNQNLNNSTFISSFMKRSGFAFGDSTTIRYRSAGSSWRSVINFVGRGRDGVSLEDFSISQSLSCSEGFWKFFFSAKTYNRFTGDELGTKLIVDIPADLLCLNGDVSALIEVDVGLNGNSNLSGVSKNVVSPSRNFSTKSVGVNVFVNGVFNEQRIYYDDIGIFKNKYWLRNMFKTSINMRPKSKMLNLEASRIFS